MHASAVFLFGGASIQVRTFDRHGQSSCLFA